MFKLVSLASAEYREIERKSQPPPAAGESELAWPGGECLNSEYRRTRRNQYPAKLWLWSTRHRQVDEVFPHPHQLCKDG